MLCWSLQGSAQHDLLAQVVLGRAGPGHLWAIFFFFLQFFIVCTLLSIRTREELEGSLHTIHCYIERPNQDEYSRS